MAGIPYMGSKRKLAPKILDYIIAHNLNAKYFYDLFGGGGAVSFEALKRSQFEQVHYNEFNTGVVALLKKIQSDGVTDEFYQWIDRETFNKHKKDDDWFGGLCKTIWSFGNNQSGYLFGPNIEQYKKWYHEVCVNKIDNTKLMAEYCKEYVLNKYSINQDLILIMPSEKTIHECKLNIRKQLNVFEKDCKLNQLRSLQQLQQLQQLEQLPLINDLIITNHSYIDVNITTPLDETVIYCDPPYKDTAQYEEKLDHDIFNEWVKNSPYKIYVSSYESDLNCVLEMDHRSTLSQTKNNKVIEKLFCNQIETITKKDFKLI